MKLKLSLIFGSIILLITSHASAADRVTSLSMLNQPGYIYEIARDGPTISGTWAVNMYKPSNGSNVNIWALGNLDSDQLFRMEGSLIKRKEPYNGNFYCLNAYNPIQGSNVNSWKCNTGDSDQYWSYSMVGQYNEYVMIEANNSGYCLNAYNPYYLTNVNLYKCNRNDQDQWFAVFRSPNYL